MHRTERGRRNAPWYVGPMSDWSDRLAERVHGVLETHPEGISEHDLIRHLRKTGCPEIPEIPERDLFSLFRTHFRLFHALYRLRDDLRTRRLGELVADPLQIRIEPWKPGRPGLKQFDRLAAYYADLSNLDRTSPEDVARMIREARKLQRTSEREQALEVLGLESCASATTIKRRYRELAMAWHPDRGGDVRRFQELQVAYAFLADR